MKNPIKVSHIFTSAENGGLEKIVWNLCQRQENSIIESDACALIDENPGISQFINSKIPFKSFSAKNRGGISSALPNLIAIIRLAKHLRKNKTSIVVVHDFFPGVLGRIAARLAGVKCIIATLHATYDWLGPLSHKTNRLLSHWTAAVIAVSNAAKKASQDSEGLPSSLYIEIPNGIDTESFKPDEESRNEIRKQWGLDDNSLVVGCIGVLRESKRQVDLIQAISPLLRENQNLHLVLVGSSRPHELEYAQLVGSMLQSLPKNQWMHISDCKFMPALYNAIDFVCLPSESEGFGLVLAEALATGKQCLATDIPAHKEIAAELIEYHATRSVLQIESSLRKMLQRRNNEQSAVSLRRAHIEQHYSLNRMIASWNITLLERVSHG